MSLFEIRAIFSCDGCGLEFSVQIDATSNSTGEDWTTYDLAEVAVRGSIGYQGPRPEGASSVQNDQHLCGICTFEKDQEDDIIRIQ